MTGAGLKSAGLAVVGALAIASCGEVPPVVSEQTGYRGTGQQAVYNPRIVAKLRAVNLVPAAPYPLEPDAPGAEKAGQAYQNVKVLGDLSVDSFNHLMASITQWVAPPEQGCNYCHNPENMASDAVYTKVVARRMIQMTRNINVNWSSHVQQTGVTCYTCHRGNAVPKNVWNIDPAPSQNGGMMVGNSRGQNRAGQASVRYASLPYDPFTPYLLGAYPIRVQSRVAVGGVETPIKSTEATYGLMMHMGGSLGVNCGYCHNSRAWQDWSQSRPQRVSAWYGIRMVREANNNYIQNLAYAMPANRKGPLGDPYKVNCATCHQGVAKPLYGVSMRPNHPQLWGPTYPNVAPMGATRVAAAPAPAATSVAAAPASAKASVAAADSPATTRVAAAPAPRTTAAVTTVATPAG